jgi:transposase InsO family protein
VKGKNEAKDKVKEYILWIEKQFKCAPKCIRIDNGTEYLNRESRRWLNSKGIELQTTTPYSPSQNRGSERLN